MYYGDIRLGDTIDIHFTTRRFSTGAPFTLAGTPVISAYVGNSTTQITAGITLSVDFDGVTGLHNVRVVASSGNGYATATNVDLVITTGTVDSVSVVGEVIGSFSIENRSAVMPTTAARTLDVSAGGEAGIDWANVGSPTTALNLSGTNIDVDQIVASVSGAVGSVTGNVGGNVSGSVGSVVGAVGSVTGNVGGNVSGSVGSVVGAAGSVTGAVGSVTGNVGGNVVGSVGSVTGLTVANLDVAVSTRLASADYTTPPSVATILTTAITESYRANGDAPTLAQFISEVLGHLGEMDITGTTKTINKFDHVTAAETFTLNDATTPTAITRAT